MSESAEPYLSIIIPAYRESRRLPATLDRLTEFAGHCGFPVEVLIVVEKSTDGTLEIAAHFAESHPNFHVIDQPVHRGKGCAVRTGMLRARGSFVFYMDADLSVPLAEIPSFLRYFEAHPETNALAGDRQHPHSRITRRQPLWRERMGKIFNRILQRLALAELRDTQCGFKAFRRETAREIFARQKLDGFAFDVEVLMLAERLGHKVASLPVEWINSPESKVRVLRDSAAMLLDAVRIRHRVNETLRRQPPNS